jgi:phytoene synthase
VQEKAAASGSSFYYAFLFLPKPRRAAITAFYAFCREVDDVVDEVEDAGVARTKLAWWQGEVARAYAGEPIHPVMKALMPLAPDYGIEARHLLAVIEGCQMDLEQTRTWTLPACHAIATWWPASWARCRPASLARATHRPRPMRTSWAWLSS